MVPLLQSSSAIANLGALDIFLMVVVGIVVVLLVTLAKELRALFTDL